MSPDGTASTRMLGKEHYQRNAWSADGSTVYGMRVAEGQTLLCSIDPQTGVEKALRKIGGETYFQDPVDIGQTFSLDPGGKEYPDDRETQQERYLDAGRLRPPEVFARPVAEALIRKARMGVLFN